MPDPIEDRIKEIIGGHLCKEPAEVKPETILIEDLGADSLDIVEIQMAIEDDLGIQISDTEMDPVETVADAVVLAKKKLAEKAAAG